jgi:hypothetical protein
MFNAKKPEMEMSPEKFKIKISTLNQYEDFPVGLQFTISISFFYMCTFTPPLKL